MSEPYRWEFTLSDPFRMSTNDKYLRGRKVGWGNDPFFGFATEGKNVKVYLGERDDDLQSITVPREILWQFLSFVMTGDPDEIPMPARRLISRGGES